jgi:actin-like ATPase involved in cell morphogenesis
LSYYLGVDLGTTFTAAAVWRGGRVDIATLGNRSPSIPSVVLLRDDGSMLVGEAAERRAAAEPRRVAREFKRRFGDPTPIVIGGTPFSADALTARVLRWVVDKVSETEGGPPAGIAISYPANWGEYKTDLLRQAIARADLDRVATVTEPEAAAIHYASQERIETGSVVAVYDLGGGTFDAAVLRKTADGWDILGDPEGVERLGGVDIDEAVFQHVTASLGGKVEQLDPDDETALSAVARLRADCVEAKEALSADTDVSIPVLLPGLQTEVRLTRRELEQMIRPALHDSITALDRALRNGGVSADDVTTVLLVGGSSRVPLVAQLVGSELGRPVAVDAHPKFGVALGAAVVAAGQDVRDVVDRSEVAAVPEPPTSPVVPAAPPLAPAPPRPGPGGPPPGGFGAGPPPGGYGVGGPAPAPRPAAAASWQGGPGVAERPRHAGPTGPTGPTGPAGSPSGGSVSFGKILLVLGVLLFVGLTTWAVVGMMGGDDGGEGDGLTVPTFPEPDSSTRPTDIDVDEIRALQDTCEAGTMADCDAIWDGTPTLSSGDGTADTCGDRVERDNSGGDCVEQLGAQAPAT